MLEYLPQIIFFILSLLAYCAGLWYEYYQVVKNYTNNKNDTD